jgi:hypothetical protein
MRPLRACLAGASLLALAAPTLSGPDASSLLFEAPALASVTTGTTLVYRLERTVSGAAAGMHAAGLGPLPSVSTVELSLHPDEGTGSREARVAIVKDDGRQAAGSFPALVGNPVLLVILERDVVEMSRALHGSPYYIRNRVREALGAATPAEPARFPFEGREVDGWRVAVSPFAQDRNRDKLREHAAKRYEFTLSDAVPGGVFEVRLVTPGADGAPLIEDRLAFERSQAPEDAPR